MPQNDISKGRPLFWRFWACASGFWERKHARVSWLLTVALVTLALAQIAVQYRLNYWNRDFFNALERRDAARLWEGNSQGGMSLKYHSLVEFAFDERILGDLGLRL